MNYLIIGSFRTKLKGLRYLIQRSDAKFYLAKSIEKPIKTVNVRQLAVIEPKISSVAIPVSKAIEIIQRTDFNLEATELQLSYEIAVALELDIMELTGMQLPRRVLRNLTRYPEIYEAVDTALKESFCPINKRT